MAIYRSLKAIIEKSPNKSRLLLTASTLTSFSIRPPCNPLCFNPFLRSSSGRFLSPLSKWIAPLQGPLFLSATPWKLLQASTPIYLRSRGVLGSVQALNVNLKLLPSSARACSPAALGVGVLAPGQSLQDRAESKGPNEGFVENFVNIPNMVSMSRLLSGPFLGWMIINEWYSAALIGSTVSGATDWLDGYLARKMNINSVVGSYLDPLADKVLIGFVALAMVYKDLLPTELVGIVVLRDVLLVCGAVYKRSSELCWQWGSWYDFFNLNGTRPEKIEPLFISKVNTVFQLVLVAAALLQPEFGTEDTQIYLTYLGWLVASTTVGSTAAYGVQHYMRRPLLASYCEVCTRPPWRCLGMGRTVLATLTPVEVASLLGNWWDEINDSTRWQDGIYYALCAAYALVSSIALIQLIRIELRVPEYGWTTQKVFHLMNFIVNGVRAVMFGFHTEVFLLLPKLLTWILLELPGLLFFSTYTLLVLFWAEIYHQQARSLPTDKLRIVYISVNVGMYFIQACLWIYLWIDDNSVVRFIGKIFIAGVSIIAALGFLLYGGRLFFMLRRFPIESKGRRKKLHEVGSVTAICFTCFIIRCIVVLVSVFDSKDASLDVLNHPVLNLIYYMLVEVLPSALVLYILRKLPPKRVSAQYHPIR
ncbi:hypothetical protein SAY86_030045 [Trapa natans]|uniref:THH1/TOM1/TOM3 domain-containing protein n=1 Tax=Trapa natans TaxID=22666 RepID=A0AAN7RA81_TRANT|nr:hypothetical protein SAY86_030045 [Trapa natans]